MKSKWNYYYYYSTLINYWLYIYSLLTFGRNPIQAEHKLIDISKHDDEVAVAERHMQTVSALKNWNIKGFKIWSKQLTVKVTCSQPACLV